MYILNAFVLAAALSAYGSLLLGLVNTAVIETTLSKSKKAALWLALGGVLPEIPYVLIAIWGVSYADILDQYKVAITITVGFIFLIIGSGYLFKKSNVKLKPTGSKKVGVWSYLSKGFLLALANPQLIFYWLTWLLLIRTGFIAEISGGVITFNFTGVYFYTSRIAFAIGAAFGAFLVLWAYVMLASRYKKQLLGIIGNRLNFAVGIIFMVLGVLTILKNVI